MSPAGFPRLPGVQSDHRLLALARAGDERAFEALVRRHRRSLLRYGRRMGLSDVRAEDVVQQSLLRAWLALERGGEVHAPKAWLYRTVHNTAVNELRSARDHAPLEEGASVEVAASVESDFERRVAVRQTLHDVAGLPRMQREAIMLTAFDGRSHDEIAVALGVTHGAVRGLLYRARSTLRDAAAAVLPQPVLLWAAGLLGRMSPGAARVTELAAPAGNADIGGALAKGAALAASAAVLAVGTGVVALPRHLGHRSGAAAQALGITPVAADAQTSASSPTRAPASLQLHLGRSSDPTQLPRSGAVRRTDAGPSRRTGSPGVGRSHDGSGDRSGSGSEELALRRGGETDLSPGGERALRGASGSLQGPQASSRDSSEARSSLAECGACGPVSAGHDEGSGPGDLETSAPSTEAQPKTPAAGGEPSPERRGRD
ncbi:MAG TPA: RNA polymerase sigma factor [Solirubrobacteraceae bacterium]|jgi:RNA polymerase sigma factor (sigma-70 family)|nr:RNA polymerase sigma factor [Solirubrobacteraceae bacterium]